MSGETTDFSNHLVRLNPAPYKQMFTFRSISIQSTTTGQNQAPPKSLHFFFSHNQFHSDVHYNTEESSAAATFTLRLLRSLF